MKNTVSIKKVLVPTDFSETGMMAIAHAGFLAKLVRADLVLQHIIPAADHSYDILGLQAPDMHYQENLNSAVDAKLAELAEDIRKEYGVNVIVRRDNGVVSREVLRSVKHDNIDLVVMGTHGVSGFAEVFIGSNAHKVVSVAPCPVLTVQESAKKLGFMNIVLPIDRSAHSRQKVDVALALADHSAAKIHILGLLESSDPVENDKLQIVLDQVEHAVKAHGLTFTRETVTGKNIAVEALKYAQRVNADLITTMTDHESTLTGPFLGVFAKQIVNHSRIPVLSVKPHDGSFAALDMGGGYSAF